MFQVRIHGRGGQGVVSAAEMLSVAAFDERRFAQAFPSFGSERMGAPVMAFCRIDDREIRLREPVMQPDALIIQEQRGQALRLACTRTRGQTPFNSRSATTPQQSDGSLALRAGNVLVEQQRVAVGVGDLEVRGPFGLLVGVGRYRGDPTRLQGALYFAHILEFFHRLLVLRPSRVKRHDVLVEHPLEQPDPRVPTLEDDPLLFELAGDHLEVELLVEGHGGFDVLDVEADGKVSEVHGLLLTGRDDRRGWRGLRRSGTGHSDRSAHSDRGQSANEHAAENTREVGCFHVNAP